MYGLLEAIILTLSCGLYLCKVVKSHILFIFYMDGILCIRVSDKIGCSLDITVKSLNAVSEKSLIDLDLKRFEKQESCCFLKSSFLSSPEKTRIIRLSSSHLPKNPLDWELNLFD